MDIGITDFYGFNEPFKTRLDRIKKAGFTRVMLSNDKKYRKQNGSFSGRIRYIRKIGLSLASLHASYDTDILPELTKQGKIGDKLEKNLIKEVKLAHKYGFKNLVVHILGEHSQVLINRIKNVLTFCEKYDVNFCVENIDQIEIFDFIHQNIQHKNLKFCYDCGHNHCFAPNKKYFPQYANLLTCTHLHDNDGTADQHIPFDLGGNIDMNELAKNLASTNITSLDFEILPRTKPYSNPDDLLNKVYENAKKLITLMNK